MVEKVDVYSGYKGVVRRSFVGMEHFSLTLSLFLVFIYLFIYLFILAALGLSCGMQDLC